MPVFPMSLKRRSVLIAVLVLLAVLAGVGVIYATANGPLGASDSMGYLAEARNILRGIGPGVVSPNGSFGVNTIQPPLYPIALAGVGLAGIDLVVAARVLNIVFVILITIFLWLIFYRYSQNPYLSISAVILVVIFPGFFGSYITIMTEALFYLLFVVGIFLLLGYFKTKSIYWLIPTAILFGLLPITRYDGIPLVVVGLVGVLLFGRGRFIERLKHALLYCAIAGLPFLLWAVYIRFQINQPTVGKDFPLEWGYLMKRFQLFRAGMLGVVWGWIPFVTAIPTLKSRVRFLAVVVIFIGVVLLTLFANRRVHHQFGYSKEEGDFQIFALACLSILIFVAFVIFTYLFFGLPARLDDRQFLPVYVNSVLVLLGAIVCWQKAFSTRKAYWMNLIPGLMVVICLVWYGPISIRVIQASHPGPGYAGNFWRNSATMAALRELPKEVPIISNNAALILFWADHPGYEIPGTIHTDFIAQTTPYGTDLSDPVQKAFRERNGVLVIFGHNDVLAQQFENKFGWSGRLRVKTLLEGLVVSGKYPDGVIYSFPK